MKKLLLLLPLAAIVSCGNDNSANSRSADSTTVDTSFSKGVVIDSSISNKMNADTTGMSEAR
ncbi:hypothetical protein [Segetibacter aerophilus]|uniref:Uncharacterized protein n=1 Tax=Segetibacter aerophilus TaxID=670293 RepID=A0A512BFV7_9BACT|nr:hypothetical protein [Segetibacter aerophilus]GEO10854.1 hypothetical protein SAE01_33500 [Segetibacter aerophilus]